MDDIIASMTLLGGKSMHIASLARQTIIDNGCEHMGCEGYWLFECSNSLHNGGIVILAKMSSMDAIFRLVDIWNNEP